MFTIPPDYYILGLYYPGFFTTHIRTDKDSILKFDTLEISTYFHEYIHYMQNITTANGVNRFLFFMDQIANLFSQINGNITIKDLFPNYFESLSNNKIKLIETKKQILDNVIDKSLREKICTASNINISINYEDQKTLLTYRTSNGSECCSFPLNSVFIYEGMAELIQSKVFKSIRISSPYFPYRVIQNVAYGILGNDLSNHDLIKICDFSLQTSNPGFTFGDICNQIKNGKTIESLWEEEIAFTKFNSDHEFYACKAYDACEFIINSDEFKEILKCVFSGDIRSEIATYLNEIFTKGATYRKKLKSCLFSDLLDVNEQHIFDVIRELHIALGMPNTFNSDESSYLGVFADSYHGAPYLPIIKRISDAVLHQNDEIPCPLRYECASENSKYHQIYSRDICNKNFMLDINEISKYCIAKSIAYSMGFGYLKWK